MVSYCIPAIKCLSDNLRLHSTCQPSSNYPACHTLFAPLGFGIVNFIFAVPMLNMTMHVCVTTRHTGVNADQNVPHSDITTGHHNLLLFTFLQVWMLLTTSFCFLTPRSSGTTWTRLIMFFMFLFSTFYSSGKGPVPFTTSHTLLGFPFVQCEQGMAWAIALGSHPLTHIPSDGLEVLGLGCKP
jgi:hypothetical protein